MPIPSPASFDHLALAMAIPMQDSFLALSSAESEVEAVEDCNKQDHQLFSSRNISDMTEKTRPLVMDTAATTTTASKSEPTLWSAVAHALGVDANELFHGNEPSSSTMSSSSDSQQPTNRSMSLRRSSTSSISVYSPPCDIAEWRKSMSNSIESRLAVAVAGVLGLDSYTLPRDESFVDLGGNHRKARELRASCMEAGLAIKTKDIMNCKTIAELETCVTPLYLSTYSENDEASTTFSLVERGLSQGSRHSYQSQVSDYRRPPSIPPKAQARYSSFQSSLQHRPSRRRHLEAEKALFLHNDVSKASVLKPKAGPFEGQLVAFVTLTSCMVESPDDCEVTMQSPEEYTGRLPAIRKDVESQVSPSHAPRVWVVLTTMPLDDAGKNHRRKLQTWIQNANDELCQQIRSIDSEGLEKPAEVVEMRLQTTARDAPQIEPVNVGMDLSFPGLGADESAAARFIAKCRAQGISLNTRDVMNANPLVQMAAVAASNQLHARKVSEVIVETFELSPMQRLYFHTPMGSDSNRRSFGDDEYRFNQSMLFRLKRSVDIEDVRAAIEAVVGHHSMLRCRFRSEGISWHQSIESEISSSYDFAHHSITSNAEIEEAITDAQAKINIEDGPVFSSHYFQTSDGSQLLYLLAHHLVVDLESWRVVADDLEGLLVNGCLVSGPSLSFKEWTLRHRNRVHHMASIGYTPSDIPAGNSEYWGVDETSNTYGNTIATGFTLNAVITSALEAGCRVLKTDPADLYVAALMLSFAQTFYDRGLPPLWNQGFERTTLDAEQNVLNTVGWFTELRFLAIDASPMDDIVAIINRVKESRRAASENGDLDFSANLIDATSALSFITSHFPLELMFTYAGTMQNARNQRAILEEIPVPGRTLYSGTSDIGRDVGRIAIIEASVLVDQGESKVKVLYPRNSTRQEQIRVWIRAYEEILRQAVNRLQHESPGLSLSDVPYMDVSDDGLDRLNREVLPSLNLNPSNVETIYPATATQQNFLINYSLIPGSSHAQMVYELDTSDGPVDISRICAIWLHVSQKYPALRTVFSPSVSKTGLYDQIILRSHSPEMLFLESDSVEDAMVTTNNVPPLLLNEGTPWHRLVVCQVAGKTLLKLEACQAVCDIGSMEILFREIELGYFYNQAPEISNLSYPEYVQCLKTTACSIEFWREHLSGVRPCKFPTLLSGSSPQSEWKTTSVDLGIPYENLSALAIGYEVDISTIFRVAWGLLLRTYVGTDTVCFGVVVSGRDLPVEGLNSAIGSFSTILTSKLNVSSNVSIAQLLFDSEEERRKVLHHQHVPVSRIEHELRMKGEKLFNTYLSFGYEYISDDLPGDSMRRHVKTEQASEYDINMDICFHQGTVKVNVGYRILTAGQAITVARAFGRAIDSILESPSSAAKEADLFSMRDHKQILTWNSTAQVEVSRENIPQLVESQALLNPDIQAICAWDGDLSYGDLQRYSIVLAKHLMASGVKPRMPVPVILNKSRWAVVAMLAVLHAGAIMVPVDAEVTSMFAWVIKTVNADIVLASDDIRKHVDGFARKVIVVNELSVSAMSAQDVDITPPQPAPYEIACILFSSEASKSPQGISYSHGALSTACSRQGPTLLINPSSRVMQISSYSVDIALSEIFTTLINGGCICVPLASEKISGFARAVRRMRVNWTYLTPTLSRKLDPDSLPDIAVVCFRARHLDGDAYAPWAGKAKVLLVYGFPEACPLGLSATEVDHSKTSQCFPEPFCGNFWVVSPEDNNRLMPVGAIGELVIGGPTLSSGFDITGTNMKAWIGKSVVRARSLLEKSGSRLLKTGHCVRYHEDGEIEFVSDDSGETEINGKQFRLSDVEPKLRQCLGRGVDVVVETIAFNDPNSAPILAAFVELGETSFQGNEDLSRLSRITRERLYLSKKMADMVLRETLPSHMVPSAYIPIKRMPLTPTLEVNRLELQRMIAGLSRGRLLGLAEVSNPQEVQDTSFKPLPLTQVEQQMRAIWAHVLGIKEDSIVVSDGFLNLGGNVVLAQDLIIECRQRGISISIIDVLQDVSLTDLCKRIATMEPSSITIRDAGTMRGYPTNAFVEQSIAPRLGSDRSLIEDVAEATFLQTTFIESGMLQSRGNINYFTFNITGSLDWQKLESACVMLTKTHPTLRTAFVSSSCQLYQTVLRSYRPEFLRYQCQSWRLGKLTAKIIKREQAQPVDFRQPITKFHYLDAGKSSVLIMRISRAQYDDVSMRMIIQDLGRFYSCRDQLIRRPGFCEVVRAAQFTCMNGATEYWRSLLDGAVMTRVVSQPSPNTASMSLKPLHRQIPTGSLQNLGIPFDAILKGAWSIVLSNLSGTDDVVFGQLIEGKDLSLPGGQAISQVVGPMGNIIPVRTRLPEVRVTPYEYFRSIQSQNVASIPHENMQTSDIVQKCTTWPSWTRFSTVVCHQNQAEDYKSFSFTIENASCKINCVESNQQESDMFVKSSMSGPTNIDISLTFCEKRIPVSFADEVLKMLSSIISLLTSTFVIEPMMLRGLNDAYSTPRIPLSAPKRQLPISSSTVVESVDPDHAHTVHTMISTAWDTILDARSLKTPDIRSVPFYETCGTLLPAAELAAYYTEKMPAFPDHMTESTFTPFTMEEIIENPTMMTQYELIIAKTQRRAGNNKGATAVTTMTRSQGWGVGRRSHVKPTINAGSSTGRNSGSGSRPAWRKDHKHIGSNGSASSMESMTMGSSSSQSEGDGEVGNGKEGTGGGGVTLLIGRANAKKGPSRLGLGMGRVMPAA